MPSQITKFTVCALQNLKLSSTPKMITCKKWEGCQNWHIYCFEKNGHQAMGETAIHLNNSIISSERIINQP